MSDGLFAFSALIVAFGSVECGDASTWLFAIFFFINWLYGERKNRSFKARTPRVYDSDGHSPHESIDLGIDEDDSLPYSDGAALLQQRRARSAFTATRFARCLIP